MYIKKSERRISQGDILENFDYQFFKVLNDEFHENSITFSFVIVLTQDCDLEWDYKTRDKLPETSNNDKHLQSILICPGYLAEQVREGTHLSELGFRMQSWNSTLWGPIKKNQNERFHFLEADARNDMPDLVLDFKRFYTISREEIYAVYKTKYKISVNTLFREDISQRFANYLSRIGLPSLRSKTSCSSTNNNQSIFEKPATS